MQIILATGSDKIYRRFPFNVEIGLNGKVVKVLEFERGDQQKTFRLPVSEAGLVTFSVVSELASVPAEIDQGPDRRELSLLATFAAVLEIADTGYRPDGTEVRGWVQSVIPTVEQLPRPVFVVGMYRSGTSILTWALGQHPNVWALEETGWLPPLANGILSAWERARAAAGQLSFGKVYEIYEDQFLCHFAGSIDHLMKSLSREHAVRVLLGRAGGYAPSFTPELQVLRALGSSKQRWVDGTPENVMCIGQLRRLFPRGKFIHLVRHPVEVVTSLVHFERAGGTPLPAKEALATWRERVALGLLAERAYGSDVVMRMDYRDLIAKPDERLRDIFSFLGEPDFDAAAAAFNVRINSSLVATEEIEQTVQSLATDALKDAMRLYAQASGRLDAPVVPDPAAQIEISKMIGDATARLMALF